MNQKAVSKPLTKTVTYMSKMICTKTWKADTRIPTLEKLSKTLDVSIGTVRKAIAILEHKRLLNNNGSFGFCVVSPKLTEIYSASKPLYFIQLLKMNADALEIIAEGGKALGKFIIKRDLDTLKIFNTISGETINTTEPELRDSMYNRITLESLLLLTGKALSASKAKYFRQQDLRDIAQVVLKKKGQ